MLYVMDQRQRCAVGIGSLRTKPPKAGTVHGPDVSATPLSHPYGMVVSRSRRTLVIADGDAGRLVSIHLSNGATNAAASAGSAIGAMKDPRDVDILSSGQLVVADTGNHRVVVSGFTITQLSKGAADTSQWHAFGTLGDPTTPSPNTFHSPTGVHADSLGRIVVADPAMGRLVRFDAMAGEPDGAGWAEIALPPGTNPAQPYGVAPGPNGTTLVTDIANARIIELTDADDSIRVLIDGALAPPEGPGTRTINAAIAAAPNGTAANPRIVVADAGSAMLTEWSLHKPSGAYRLTRRLSGLPHPTGGPVFTEVSGLTSTGAAR
jgi:hypothetical protein